MQDEIVTHLARAIQVELTTAEASRIARAHPENPDAEELALQCEAAYLHGGPISKEMAQASGVCEQALRIDKNNVRALVVLAIRRLALLYNWQSIDPQADRLAADEPDIARPCDRFNNYFAHYARSQFLAAQRPDEAIVEAERLFFDASFFRPTFRFGSRTDGGTHRKADQYLDEALRLGPQTPLPTYFSERRGTDCSTSHATKWRLSFSTRDCRGTRGRESQLQAGGLPRALRPRCGGARGIASLSRAAARHPKTIAQFKARQPYDSPNLRSYYDRLYEGLRKAGLPEE